MRRTDGPRRPDPARDQRDRRAAELARTTGLSLEAARLVASGRADLNDLLKKMAFRDEVERIIQRHDLNRALATQVALGHADLAQVLRRRSVDAHLAIHRDRSILDESARTGTPLTLGLHGHRTLHARIVAVEPYEVVLTDIESGVEERVHKLRFKYAYKPDDHKRVRKSLQYDKARRDRTIEPIARPQDRYGCSDRRLGEAMELHHPVAATTLEGECFTGEIVWISRYEFALKTRSGGEVIVFRHALDELRDEKAAP